MKACLSVVALVVLLAVGVSASASPYPLEEILDKAVVEKLAKEKIATSDELLKRAAVPKARRALARATKLPARKLAAWARMCDVLRLKGVGPKMVQLLAAGRVTTVKQLRAQKGAPLHKRLMQANKRKKITENPPTEEQISAWIDQAKQLELVLR